MSKYYIARDKDNTLRVFDNKPAKHGWNFWQSDNTLSCRLRESWFPEVKWEDKEPKVLTIEESPWIKIEDRLPDVEQEVLCCYIRHPDDKRVYIVNHIYNNVKELDGYDMVAWMPIHEFNDNGI